MCGKGVEQSLEEILRSKDERVAFHEKLLEKFNGSIISYKLNIPGPIKYNSLIKKIFDEGMIKMKEVLQSNSIKILYEKVVYKNSGPECFISFDVSPYEVKELCTQLEDTHPLGRLFDMDILDHNGRQISRQDQNIHPRKCLICNKSAAECGRSRKHDLNELLARIENMATEYFTN